MSSRTQCVRLSYDYDRKLYAAVKRELSKKVWKYVQNYADAKTEVVQEIMKRAEAAQQKYQSGK